MGLSIQGDCRRGNRCLQHVDRKCSGDHRSDTVYNGAVFTTLQKPTTGRLGKPKYETGQGQAKLTIKQVSYKQNRNVGQVVYKQNLNIKTVHITGGNI